MTHGPANLKLWDQAEQIGEPELACLSVSQRRFLRLQFSVCQRQLRWPANPVTSTVMLPEASIPMRRKVIQHFANMFCQRLIDLPSGYDLARFVKLGKGTAALNILDGECTHNGSPVDRFDTCNEYKEWLFRELERHSIAPDTIVHARMEVDATVSNIEIKESFGHVLRSADFSFDCRSAIQTDEKTYSFRQFEEKRWGYDYYWGMLYGDVDVKAT